MTRTVVLTVHVKPGSRKGPLVEVDDPALMPSPGATTAKTDASLTVYLQQRAVEGAANDALVSLLARHFAVPKRAVSIVRGHASRTKQVRIDREP